MSEKKFNTQEEKDEELRREYRAYEELRMIIAIAIETGNFAILEPNIALWENKYHVEEFIDPEIVRKIRAILNKDFLSRLIGDYLASMLLHEQQRQQAAYDSLKSIIAKAKKSKNYKNAEKEIIAWKASLSDQGLSLYTFNKSYTKQIFKMLLFPSRELATQQEASDSLKRIVNDSKTMESAELEKEITTWKGKYSLDSFPDKLEEELNGMTADIFKSITIKRSEEAAISELQSFISSDKMSSPADEIPALLSKYDYSTFSDLTKNRIDELTTQAMSLIELDLSDIKPKVEEPINTYIPPLQQAALYDLKDIFSKSSSNMEAIFNWIYLYRTLDFVPEARDEIKTMFRIAGFAKPTDGVYSIPSLETSMDDLKQKDINEIREKVILSYLGMLYTNSRSLSSIEQSNISTIRSKQEVLHAVTDAVENTAQIVLPVSDNEPTASSFETNDSYTTTDVTSTTTLEPSDLENENVQASEILEPVVQERTTNTENEEDITATSVVTASQIENSVSSDIVYENPEEVNILIEDLLQDPAESIELSSKDKKAEKKVKENEEVVEQEPVEDVTAIEPFHHEEHDEDVQEIEPDLSQDDLVEDQKHEIKDPASSINNREPEVIEATTNSEEPEEEKGTTSTTTTSMLTADEQESIENINYMTTSYSMQKIPFFKRRRTIHEAERLGYTLEKNNGF